MLKSRIHPPYRNRSCIKESQWSLALQKVYDIKKENHKYLKIESENQVSSVEIMGRYVSEIPDRKGTAKV